ncbi:hypothetical protein ACLOJK_018155 [Asimina triloba]
MGRRSTEIRCSITFTRSFHGRHHPSAIQAGHMGQPLQQLRSHPAHQRTAVGSHDQQLQIGHRRHSPNLKFQIQHLPRRETHPITDRQQRSDPGQRTAAPIQIHGIR